MRTTTRVQLAGDLSLTFLKQLIARMPMVDSVRFGYPHKMKLATFVKFMAAMTRLRSLEVSCACGITPAHVLDAARKLPNLTHISLHIPRLLKSRPAYDFTLPMVRSFAIDRHNMKEDAFYGDQIDSLLRAMPNLESLSCACLELIQSIPHCSHVALPHWLPQPCRANRRQRVARARVQ